LGDETQEGKKLPFRGNLLEESTGLLVIAGRTREGEKDLVREEHENKLLREALKRGKTPSDFR